MRMSDTPEHRAWSAMRERCGNPRLPGYKNYGGRGIRVCPEWAAAGSGFALFLAHVGPRPSPKHSIDRINNDGNYEPGNVRWATRTEQNENRRNACNVTWAGRTQTVAAWARELGLSRMSLVERLDRMPLERAMTKRPRRRLITAFGRTMTIRAWSRETGVSWQTIGNRISSGWPVERALTEAVGERRVHIRRVA